MRRTLLLLAVLAAALLAVLFGGVLAGGGSGEAARASSAAAGQVGLESLLQGFSTGDTAGTVRRLESAVRRNPKDGASLTLLGLAYQQRARETADPAYYTLSGRALARSLAAGGPRSLTLTGLASLDVARHRYAEGLTDARRAIALDAGNGSAWLSLGDAYFNLGRYPRSFRAFDRAAELSPSVASYARIGIAREALGRSQAADAAIRLALELDASRTVPEHEAWTLVQLGNVRFNVGRYAGAAAAFRGALLVLPRYVHAEVGLARVDAVRGRLSRAASRLQDAVDRLPLPLNAILLGDVLHAAGRDAAATRAYRLVGAIERVLAANGVRTELQTALFDLDHGRRVGNALARARAAYAQAPSVVAADVVAWGLLRNGRCAEAVRYSKLSLRLGTRDALRSFHRGMIERCLGRPAAARTWFRRALALNPGFSLLWEPVARRYA